MIKRSRSSFNESTRNRAFMISILGGLTLLALAATVFAVAVQARSVSSLAEQMVRSTEQRRVIAISRAELSIAERVASLSPDRGEIIAASVANAMGRMDEVQDDFDDTTPEDVTTAFAGFRQAANNQAEVLESGAASADARLTAEIATGEAFETLDETLRTSQVEARDQLSADNDLMNIISTIATFVVAFVVPSAALYIFEALRRTPRRARQLEHAYETTTATSLAMAAAVSKEAAQLREAIGQLPPHVNRDQLSRSVLRFEHVAALNGSVRTLHNKEIDVRELSIEITRTIGHPIVVNDEAGEDAIVHGDPEQISLVLTELLSNAVVHGLAPVELEVRTEERQIVVLVSDHGPGLPEVVEDAIIHDNDYATRGNLLSGTYGFGLLAAREAAEALGGRLRYHREEGETTLLVEFPRSGVAPLKPVELDLPSALEIKPAA